MILRKILLFLGTVFFICDSTAQMNNMINIHFAPTFGVRQIDLSDSAFAVNENSKFVIEVLKFYVSDFRFLNKGKEVGREKNSYHLVDASIKSTLDFKISAPLQKEFDQLIFNLGIDSTTNVSGVLGGDLDPTKGMYWTWQSGYINFKLEGTSNLCKTRNNEFQFHLGGYQYPYSSIQEVSLLTKNDKSITIKLDIEKAMNGIDLSKQDHIMSPKSEAVVLSNKFSKAFTIE